MKLLRTLSELRAWRSETRASHQSLGFVPTMGYLHAGHLTLCRQARESCDVTCVSIFVNPLQFGPREDLSRYPRDEVGDLKKLQLEGVAAVFLPSVEEMYPPEHCTRVEVSGLSTVLCGRSRPGHFQGVATVVARLFNLVQPDSAFFGLKDYQQFQVVRRMVMDLGMEVNVVGVPTVRENDGLAMSSRNSYLDPSARQRAVVLFCALQGASLAYHNGMRKPEELCHLTASILQREPVAEIDYVEVVDAETLGEPREKRPQLLALAVRMGGTRLIDNIVLSDPG